MSDERLRVQLEPAYAQALGRATYCFAILEWRVVWCGESIQVDWLKEVQHKAAGLIGLRFEKLVASMPDSELRDRLRALGKDFMELVDQRNQIIHGKPSTAPGGEQRLGAAVIPELDTAADRFIALALLFEAEFFGPLKDYEG